MIKLSIIATIVLGLLKLFGVLSISWLIVAIPIFVMIGYGFLVYIFALVCNIWVKHYIENLNN